MKKMKIFNVLIIIGIVFCIWSCEKTEISLNSKGDPTTFTGTWVTTNYISITKYLVNVQTPAQKLAGDFTYRDTTVVDSTTLTFVFGAGRVDSVQVTAVKILNKVPQAPVKLANAAWSFTIGTSTGDEKSGVSYFLIYQTLAPGNTANGYGTSYTYKLLSPTQMDIQWVSTNGTAYNSLQYEAILNKQ
jgi:hypothetical protein